MAAIVTAARELAAAINPDWLEVGTLVPVPPSKMRGDPLFDDRLFRVGALIRKRSGAAVDVREVVRQTASIMAAHETQHRPTVDELLAIYEIDESVCQPAPTAIGIFDDVLTAGTHYRAVHTLLARRFPGVPIVGLFIARRVFPPSDPGAEFLPFGNAG